MDLFETARYKLRQLKPDEAIFRLINGEDVYFPMQLNNPDIEQLRNMLKSKTVLFAMEEIRQQEQDQDRQQDPEVDFGDEMQGDVIDMAQTLSGDPERISFETKDPADKPGKPARKQQREKHKQVIEMLKQGENPANIAQALGISVETVRWHKSTARKAGEI